MTLIRWNGTLLRGLNGKLARDIACCCGGTGCCKCGLLESYFVAGTDDADNWRLKVVLSGDGPSGTIYLCPSLLEIGGEMCFVFRAVGCTDGLIDQIGSCFNLLTMDLYCFAESTNFEDLVLHATTDSADCALGTWELISATCNTHVELVFEAPIVDTGSGCTCVGTIRATITTETTWP